MRYYIKEIDGVIQYIGLSASVPNDCEEITKRQYDEYMSVFTSIPKKDGYTTFITLYVDGTYTVEYQVEEVDNEL